MLLSIVFVLADAGVDPLSGGAGWVGAGLLGAVLGWVLGVYIPSKDKQLTTMIETKDKQIETILIARDQSAAQERQAHQSALNQVTEHCARETDRARSDADRLVAYLQIALETARDAAAAAKGK